MNLDLSTNWINFWTSLRIPGGLISNSMETILNVPMVTKMINKLNTKIQKRWWTILVTNQCNRIIPSSLVSCQFKVNFGFVHCDTESQKLAQWKRPVKILRSNWKHTCGCSAKTQTMGQKFSGFYQKNIFDRKLEPFLEIIKNNYNSTNLFCKLITKMGFKSGIQVIDIANLRTRALRFILAGK